MSDKPDLEHTLLAQLVAAKLPEMLAGGGSRSDTDLKRVERQLNDLVREFDRFSTSVNHRLEEGARFREDFPNEVRALKDAINSVATSAAAARAEIAKEALEARKRVRDGLLAIIREALDERDVRLAEISGKLKPVTEGVEGAKWARRYWRWIVGGLITVIVTIGALLGAWSEITKYLGAP